MPEANELKPRDYSEAAKSLESALGSEEPANPAEAKLEPEPGPEPQPEPEAAKPEDQPPPPQPDAENAERTRLGRRVKKLEDLIGELVTELRESRKTPEPAPDVPETVATPDDVRRILAVEEQRKLNTQRVYHENYRKAIDALGSENEDVHEEVIKEILSPNSPFNQILSENPFADAERNYYRAVKAVLKKKAASPVKPKANVRAEKPIAPTGVPVGTTVNAPNSKPFKIDEYARDFMRRMGMSDKSAEDALR